MPNNTNGIYFFTGNHRVELVIDALSAISADQKTAQVAIRFDFEAGNGAAHFMQIFDIPPHMPDDEKRHFASKAREWVSRIGWTYQQAVEEHGQLRNLSANLFIREKADTNL